MRGRSSSLGNTVELSSGNLRQSSAFDTIRATFNQAIKLGQLKESKLSAEYDYSANRDFLKEASLTGDLAEGDVSVSYDVTHDFKSKATTTKLSAKTTTNLVPTLKDLKVGAEAVDMSITEVSAERDVDLGANTVNVQPSWLTQAKTARVKLMSKLDSGDKLSAQVDYTPDGGKTSYEVSIDHNLQDGRDVSATLAADTGAVDVEYVDTKTEKGATWTATASVPYEGGNILDRASIAVKRSWAW